MTVRILAALALAASAPVGAALAQEGAGEPVLAKLVDTGGQEVGEVVVSAAGTGLLIRVEAHGLPPGAHGMHLHQVGDCDSLGGFESAGDHIAGPEETHGLRSEAGPHDGDLPNLHIGADGTGVVEIETPRLPLRSAHTPLLDQDGSALVIHANEDDHMSEDGGGSGARIACAVLEESDASPPSSAE